jgi:hypothetical protein
MILRLFRVIVHEGQQSNFRRFFLGTALPFVHSHAGLESVSVGLPHETSPNEFSMVMVWRDLEALKGFAGENWREAVIHPDEAHLLKETHVHHYELARIKLELPPIAWRAAILSFRHGLSSLVLPAGCPSLVFPACSSRIT